ncbi:MAG: exodeoxyribonuclease III [bacterium]|nr:exodeoxyribonuclease III [bacterium]
MAKKTNYHLMSWNVNGIRAAIKKGFIDFANAYNPDVLCLQETKAMQGQAEIDLPQYEEYWNSAERKGYSGTAIFTKHKPLSVSFGMDHVKDGHLEDVFGDAQKEGRVMTAEYDEFYLVTVYTPNSKRSLERLDYRHKLWDPAFLLFVKELKKKKPVVICGDLNVAHNEIDLARPKDNHRNAGFTDEEREAVDKLIAAGFVDTFRLFNKEGAHYTWWSNFANSRANNVGWRIDYFFVSFDLVEHVTEATIHPEVMGSDHCPVSLKLEF